MTNILHASDRFGQGQRAPKPTPLQKLRQTKRVDAQDRSLLASRLGEAAANLKPDSPAALAQQWFEQAWPVGERWSKRKRYIRFPGEDERDPFDTGAYVAAGSDWAALIEQVAKSSLPNEGATARIESDRFCRDMLRGTAFLPALSARPLRDESAQTLMVSLATKISDRLQNYTDICRLWNVLATTPFDIESYRLDKFDQDSIEHLLGPKSTRSDRNVHAMTMAMHKKNITDSYAKSPLGAASKLAEDVAAYRWIQVDHIGYRFELSKSRDQNWIYPFLRLGLRGHIQKSKIFVIPHGFAKNLHLDSELDDEEFDARDHVVEWLTAKGLISGEGYEQLPDVAYDEEKGYGWRSYSFEVAQKIYAEVREKSDGTPGIWVGAYGADGMEIPSYYPCINELDTLAADAGDPWLSFLPDTIGYNLPYEWIEWPTYQSKFMVDRKLPKEAICGLLDHDWKEYPNIEGWLDDLDNLELQALLFSNDEGVRFCPAIEIDNSIPPNCQQGTIAAAIFGNASCDRDERLGQKLIHQANVLASAGLGFHDALIALNRSRIESMFDD